MTLRDSTLSRVGVIIPALNEAGNLARLLPALAGLRPGQIVVGDNGSTDGTGDVAKSHGVDVRVARQRGYGAACHAALQGLTDGVDIVIFVNADLTDDVSLIPAMVRPIAADECDLTLGARVRPLRQPGSMSLPQRFGDRLATGLIRLTFDRDFYDLGPFRAIRRASLDSLAMRDRGFGWTVEMQIRAVQEGLRIQQLPVPYLRSPTPNRIGGTPLGVYRAARGILGTWYRLWRDGP